MADSLYNQALMEHVQHPDYNYELESCTHSHDGVNPSCGDHLTLHARLANDGRIEEVSWTGSGCAVSQASCDMMADLVIGLTPDQATELCNLFRDMILGKVDDQDLLEEKLDEASCLKSISRMPARVKCAELGWRTLEEMLKSFKDEGSR